MSEDLSNAFDMLVPVIKREIGLRIREAREEQGLSQTELAQKLQRRQAYISELETGKTEPAASTLVLLSFLLQKPVTYFFPPHWRDMSREKEIKTNELSVEEENLIKKIRELELGFSFHLAVRLINVLIEAQASDEEIFNWPPPR